MHNAPLIVRIAGLPVGAIERFSTTLCEKEIAHRLHLEARLDETRAKMVEGLHDLVRDASADQRRFYLNLKRDCFNNRSVCKYLDHPQWALIDRATQEATREIAELESALKRWHTEFETSYAEKTTLNREHLIKTLSNQPLLNGIALASPTLAHQLPRLSSLALRAYKKKERKLELGALRYVSRSGLKLSPYSTLTRLGLGLVKENDAQQQPLTFLPGAWTQTSLVRIKRYILEQFADALLLSLPFKRSMLVSLNSTLEEVGLGKHQFIRPGQWREAPPGVIKYFLDSLVTTRLSGSVIEHLREILHRRQCSYEQLVERLQLQLGESQSVESAAQAIDELIKVGYLNIQLPWHTNDTSWERKTGQYLAGLEDLHELAGVFEEINSVEDQYGSTPAPVSCISQMEALIDKGWDGIRSLTGIKNTVNLIKTKKKYVYQDVMIANRHESATQQELLHIPARVIKKLTVEIEPLMRLSMLRWHGYDFLHTVGAFLSRHPKWRGRSPLLHLMVEINPIWQEYVKYDLEYRKGGMAEPFNPLQLEEVRRLHDLRRRMVDSFPYCTALVDDELRIDLEALRTLVREIPAEYISPHGPCMMVQPADTTLERWVLNRLKEGTGRLGSRFVPLMSDSVREFYTSSLVQYGQYIDGGERSALLDLMCINGDTLNVHPVQTPFVLEMPGSNFDVPAQRRVSLNDLFVQVTPERKLPRVYSTKLDQRLIPVHLGGAGHDFLSSEIRFLCLFGPCEMDLLLFPQPAELAQGEIIIQRRVVNGSIVLSRKRWLVPLTALPEHIQHAPDHEAFTEINRWRISQEIPERAFLRLNSPGNKSHTRHKPQFVDFSSPLFVRVFLAALAKSKRLFILEEALPQPSIYPFAADQSQWAIELLLDTIVSNHVRG